jgi:Alcohol dehydrogenase transcription factor Myb/SANT-like
MNLSFNQITANVVQKRWKVLREKFSVAYRKQETENVPSKWKFYNNLKFLIPFVNVKVDKKPSYPTSRSEQKDFVKSPLDEHLLISLIKAKPALYNKKDPDFRSSSVRKKAWEDIAVEANFDVETLQKRWRVMRDRFVRDLRRSQNLESDTGQVHCSAFFRDMVFLAQHVRSKKYEVDAQVEGISEEIWQDQTSLDESDDKDQANDQISECSEYEPFIEESETLHYEEVYENTVDESGENFECFEELEEHVDSILEPDIKSTEHDHSESYLEDPDLEYQDDTMLCKKRRISAEIDDQPRSKFKSDAESSARSNEDTTNNDEDIAFGNTIGCMLKKIPAHLKTAVKLKLLQSLAEFEAQHKIN